MRVHVAIVPHGLPCQLHECPVGIFSVVDGALGDTLPTVIDRGLVGGCNLTAVGAGISIGSP